MKIVSSLLLALLSACLITACGDKTATEAAGDAVNATTEAVGNAADATSEAASDAVEAAGDAADAVGDAVEAAGDAVSGSNGYVQADGEVIPGVDMSEEELAAEAARIDKLNEAAAAAFATNSVAE